MTRKMMTGNEAIARGAYEYGVRLGAGYPGTPSTEILENFARYPGIYAEWAPNEKVALEVAIGAAMAGARALVTMKHVGVNVAADPLLTLAYTGVNGGLVLVAADDPGMHSSQNEQDTRHYARLAKVPVLEPSDSQEAKDMVGLALEISERFDIPVILRTTTRVAHSQSFVQVGQRQEVPLRPYQKDVQKWLMVPAFGRLRRQALEQRLSALREYAESAPVNKIFPGEGKIGVITSGISFQYVRELLPGASILKLGLTYPLPEQLIKKFAAGVDRLLVVEEQEPFLEDHLKQWGIPCAGKAIFPAMGEFSTALLRRCLQQAGILPAAAAEGAPDLSDMPAAPVRPPVLCAGCPHRGVFYLLNKMKLLVTGDIGCYTLGGLPPLSGIDSCVCMGASIGMAHGIGQVAPELGRRTVAVIGDSTFMHSGLTGLLNVVYNRGSSVVLILDNSTTAMTGHQDHPATGRTLLGQEAPAVDMVALVRALGVPHVVTVDPLDLKAMQQALEEALAADGPAVIIARRPCVLLRKLPPNPVAVDEDKCTGCKTCLKLSCPALSVVDKKCRVDSIACVGCNLCVQVCKFAALQAAQRGETNA